MSVKLVVDSACDLDVNEAKQLGIELVSMEIMFENESFLDGVNLTHKQFFEKLIESSELPKTSQVNEFRWNECLEKIVSNGDEAIVITISSKLSGTYSQAVKAANNFPNKVFVVDSLNACIGQRILVEYASKLVNEKLDAKSIFDKLEEQKKKIRLMALLGTLKYLKKGGRISSFVAFVGEALNMKPVVEVINGEVKLVGKAMGSKKGNNLLMNMIKNGKGINFEMPFATAYSGLEDSLLKKYLEDSKELWENSTKDVPIYTIGSTIGTHAGPGAIAVAYFEK